MIGAVWGTSTVCEHMSENSAYILAALNWPNIRVRLIEMNNNNIYDCLADHIRLCLSLTHTDSYQTL